MPLPPSVTLIPVEGKIIQLSTGDAATGYVDFIVAGPLYDKINNVVLGPSNWRATLDEDGYFLVDLPATDDPDLSPSTWTYRVEVRTDIWATWFKGTVPVGTVGVRKFTDMLP